MLLYFDRQGVARPLSSGSQVGCRRIDVKQRIRGKTVVGCRFLRRIVPYQCESPSDRRRMGGSNCGEVVTNYSISAKLS